jgi:hypothetical protein
MTMDGSSASSEMVPGTIFTAFFAVFATVVRVTYFFVCLVAVVFTAYVARALPVMLDSDFPFDRGPDFGAAAWTALVVLVFGATSVRALWRVVRRRAIVSDAHIAERWIVATLITLASLFAHLLVALVFHALWSTYPDFDGNAAGPLALAGMLYAFSLLAGEAVLVGKGVRSVKG